ncbi:MAG: protein-disulfide reductase DsbD domain-containing protein [Myxococcota bacterium]
MILTTDEAPFLKETYGDGVPFASVSPSLWGELGLQSPRREAIPHPTTLVVDTDGSILLQEVHVNFKERTSVARILDAIAAAGPATAAPAPLSFAPTGPNWEAAVDFSFTGGSDCLLIDATVKDGFHVYGAKEQTARPLELSIHEAPQLPLVFPDGDRKVLDGLGESWVLAGALQFGWPLPETVPPTVTGTLRYQVCTDRSCSPPKTMDFSVDRPAEACPPLEDQP